MFWMKEITPLATLAKSSTPSDLNAFIKNAINRSVLLSCGSAGFVSRFLSIFVLLESNGTAEFGEIPSIIKNKVVVMKGESEFEFGNLNYWVWELL